MRGALPPPPTPDASVGEPTSGFAQEGAATRMWGADSTPPASSAAYMPGIWRIQALQAARILERGSLSLARTLSLARLRVLSLSFYAAWLLERDSLRLCIVYVAACALRGAYFECVSMRDTACNAPRLQAGARRRESGKYVYDWVLRAGLYYWVIRAGRHCRAQVLCLNILIACVCQA